MKCKNCGAPLQIEDLVCKNCGTANPFARTHQEDMLKYEQAFEETKKEVLKETRKTTGIMVKIMLAMALILIGIIIIVVSSSNAVGRNNNNAKIHRNADKYRSSLEDLERDRDYIGYYQYMSVNGLNTSQDFTDCLNLFNECLYYNYMASYLADISYPDYMENAFRDYENYCESIIDSYSQIMYYYTKDDNENSPHYECMTDCVNESKALIRSVFSLDTQDMSDFDNITDNERISILMENWPYEK